MAAFSDYLENKLVDATLRGQSFTAPSTVYLSLFTADPTDANTGNELTDSGYVRQDMAKGGAVATGWAAPSNGVTSNAQLIQFPPIADGTVVLTHYALFDAQSGGNMLYHSSLTTSKTMEVSDVTSFDIGALTITIR